MAEPAAQIATPTRKPARRPIRLIKSAAGTVARALPMIIVVNGRVASALSVASAAPVIPPMMVIMVQIVMNSAWHTKRTATFFFSRDRVMGFPELSQGLIVLDLNDQKHE